METFSALLALCEGNPPVTGGFPSQVPVPRSFDVFLICTRTNAWANNRHAGDFRHHRAHYDVTIIDSKLYYRALDRSRVTYPKINHKTIFKTKEFANWDRCYGWIWFLFNSLPASDAIWQQIYWWTMAKIITPNHDLNQCWLEIIAIHPSVILQIMQKISFEKKIKAFYAYSREQCITFPGSYI